jgi:hypothetical protein
MVSYAHAVYVICYLCYIFNAHLCNHIMPLQVVVGLRARFCALLEVCGGWELGCCHSTRGVLYAEDQGLQVPMALEHGKIGGELSFVANCIVDPTGR